MDTIRRAIADDAAALTALMHASTAYHGTYRAILHGYHVSVAQIARDMIFVYELKQAIVGFYSLAYIGDDLELDLLFVADTAQGNGVGATLFQHMIRTAANQHATRVKIVAHPPALNFYVRMGAEIVGVKAPSGAVSWERPVLTMHIRTALVDPSE